MEPSAWSVVSLTHMRIFLFLLCSAGLLRADAIADLKTALASQSATSPVAARITYAFTNTLGEDKAATSTTGQATAQVTLMHEGLRIIWSPDLLASLDREAAESTRNPNAASPTREAMKHLDGSSMIDYLNAAPQLLRELSLAQLTGEQADTWQGKPARRLSLKLEVPLSEEDRKVIKQVDATAQLWLDADGLPLAAERTISFKGRAMLVITFEHSQKEKFEFVRTGGRLVTVTHTSETADKGGGQHTRSQTQTTLALIAP